MNTQYTSELEQLCSTIEWNQEQLPLDFKPTYIYYLSSSKDPLNVRYIGKTINLKHRLKQHTSEANSTRYSHKANWIRSEIKKGNEIVMTPIELLQGDFWIAREIYHIQYYKDLGFKLTNATNGGEGKNGWNPTEETRNNIAKSKPRKAVVKFDLYGDYVAEYPSIIDAARSVDRPKDSGTIYKCCKGIRRQAYGFAWRFKQDIEDSKTIEIPPAKR